MGTTSPLFYFTLTLTLPVTTSILVRRVVGRLGRRFDGGRSASGGKTGGATAVSVAERSRRRTSRTSARGKRSRTFRTKGWESASRRISWSRWFFAARPFPLPFLPLAPLGPPAGSKGRVSIVSVTLPAEELPAEVGEFALLLLHIAQKDVILVGGVILKADP